MNAGAQQWTVAAAFFFLTREAGGGTIKEPEEANDGGMCVCVCVKTHVQV